MVAQVSKQNSDIGSLMAEAEQEKAAAAAQVEQNEAQNQEVDTQQAEGNVDDSVSSDESTVREAPGEEETSASSSSSTSTDIIVEETVDDEALAVEDAYEDSSSSSGQGTYLGNFTLTAYCNCAQCCGTAGNYTASGTWPQAGRTVAMAGVPFGTQLLINGNVYTVEDLGTPYGHVDIYFDSHEEALAFGLQSADVYRLS